MDRVLIALAILLALHGALADVPVELREVVKALSNSLFTAQTDQSRVYAERIGAQSVLTSTADADKLADAVAAADATGFEHVGVLGFCMGGMYAMKSLESNRFSRAVAFYGMVRVPEQWSGGTQGDAIDVVNERRERGDLHLLGIFGTNDPWCPLDQVDELEAAGAEVVRYDGADHGWAQDPTRDNYREADATDAWARAEARFPGYADARANADADTPMAITTHPLRRLAARNDYRAGGGEAPH